MGSGLGLAQLVLQPAGDDLALEVEVVAEQVAQRERPRHAVDERDRVVAPGRLQRRVLVELVQDDLRDRLALQVDLDAHAGLVGEVLDVGDLRDHLLVDEIGDLLDHARVAALLHPVGQLAHDDRGLAAAQFLDVSAGPHDDSTAARAVRLADPLAADDDPARREVGALDVTRQAVDVDLGVVDQRDERVDHLAEIVRRDVRRHADCNALRPVDEQVRVARRENARLPARLVVVGDEVDGVGVDVAQQLGRQPREPALGVPHRRSGVVVDVPEVPLPVDERVAHRERLRHADERVVDRDVAVRVVRAHHVADDARALEARPIRLETGFVHREEDAPMHRFEAVADVRQRARDDHAHRVVEEARAHLLLELARLDPAGAEWLNRRHSDLPRHQTSRNRTSFAFVSMKSRRGST